MPEKRRVANRTCPCKGLSYLLLQTPVRELAETFAIDTDLKLSELVCRLCHNEAVRVFQAAPVSARIRLSTPESARRGGESRARVLPKKIKKRGAVASVRFRHRRAPLKALNPP